MLTTQASLVLVAPSINVPTGRDVIRVAQPSAAFGKLVSLTAPAPIVYEPGIDGRAVIHPTAKIHPKATVLANAVVEAGVTIGSGTVLGANSFVGAETRIGDDCFIYSNVSIRERCLIGNRVILHHGAVIGSDGFGYEFVKGRYQKIPQTGVVQIDDDVEIGANAAIDRGRFGRTWIKQGVKIDNLVQIAHNVIIDENTAIAAQAGISGSTLIGKNVRIAGQVGTVGHITIGNGAILGAQSGINHDVEEGKFMFGYPAQEHREAMKTHANIRRLPYMVEKIRKLEERVRELEKLKAGY
jgi:UDP-3-O-[3-hydroxymyristoyl] glucosamine N-acyltransferase